MDERDALMRACQETMMRALARTADVRRRQGRDADAVRLYRQALELCDAVCGPDAGERAAILRGLALIESRSAAGPDGKS